LFAVFYFFLFNFLAGFFGSFAFFAPDVVFHAFDTRLLGTISAAKKVFLRFDAVTDNFAAAMRANRREPVNRALETIENVPISRRYDFKCQVVIVAADFTLRHFSSPLGFRV
jgi:hypothetical protein